MPDIERSMKLINLIRLVRLLIRLVRLLNRLVRLLIRLVIRLDFLMRVLPGFLCGVRPVSNLAW